jgi:hypothetical protein
VFTLIGATVAQLDDAQATVELEVLETETARIERVTVTIGLTFEREIDGIEAATFHGRELEGFVRSVYATILKRIAAAREGAS